MFGSSLPPVVCRRAHVLFTLCVCLLAHSGVHHILCCVFVLIFFVLLPDYVDGLFVMVSSVFSNVYLQLLL